MSLENVDQWVWYLPLLIPAAPLAGWLSLKIIGWLWDLLWNL